MQSADNNNVESFKYINMENKTFCTNYQFTWNVENSTMYDMF